MIVKVSQLSLKEQTLHCPTQCEEPGEVKFMERESCMMMSGKTERRMRKLAFNRYRVRFYEVQGLWTECGNDDLTVDVLNASDLHMLSLLK